MLYSKIEGSGKPLLIIHGFLGMSDNWKTLSGQYAESGYQVHALDLRNHGRSFHSDEFTYEAMARDLYDYCIGSNLTSVAIIGHSMGGKVAMLFAVTHPDMVDKLIVADIGPKYYAPHHDDIFAALNAVDFSTKPTRAEVEERMKSFIPDFGTRQFLMKSLYWKQPDQLSFRFNLEAFNKNMAVIGQALPEGSVYQKPVLFIRGENSRYVKDQDMALIEQYFPKAELETVSNAGHWLHAENPGEFLSKTLGFLQR